VTAPADLIRDRHAIRAPGAAARLEARCTVHTTRARARGRDVIEAARLRRYMLVHRIAERVTLAIRGCSEQVSGDFCDCVRQITAMVLLGTPYLERDEVLDWCVQRRAEDAAARARSRP